MVGTQRASVSPQKTRVSGWAVLRELVLVRCTPAGTKKPFPGLGKGQIQVVGTARLGLGDLKGEARFAVHAEIQHRPGVPTGRERGTW